jgi:Mannose-6-phosphate isomerase
VDFKGPAHRDAASRCFSRSAGIFRAEIGRTLLGFEHCIVVRGAAKMTINDTVRTVHENESVYIPLGAVHRLENPGKILLELIEVQTGSYFGEDDIIRIEDDYRRK